MQAPFDEPASIRINQARGATLRRILDGILEGGTLKTGIDVGCGFGYFANCLQEAGLQTTALDGREENIFEASRRYPDIDFHVRNVEDPELPRLGTFDVVSCFGLVYHLENPMLAMRNLSQLARHVLILESVVVPFREVATILYEEEEDVDQGLTYVALIPSESWLVKVLYLCGFANVYRASPLPDHPDFQAGSGKRRRRTVLAAARSALDSAGLKSMPEPQVRRHLWDTVPGLQSPRVRAAVHALKSLGRVDS